ncbi:hypothetical protein [Spirochaeta isovalerica]|uniref:Uncharacterized protein n=1 Tax=Spirochaeta isovalerica TaxID=150 RepID=A0A841RAF0_9SPIO|nr:hypothetical protein [Spirochaeta isovalerica]MBB6479990.1 hypothetical protein [Spirochaeta isovalerica]
MNIVTLKYFEDLDLLCAHLQGQGVEESYSELKNLYFDEFLKSRNEILPLAPAGGPYPSTHEEFLRLGVRILE